MLIEHKHWFLSPGKALTDPLLLSTGLVILLLILSLRRIDRDRVVRRLLVCALASTVLIALLSTGLAVRMIESTLLVRALPDAEPDIIEVAAGGSNDGFLSPATEARVQTAVAWWRLHPHVRIIMAGTDELPSGDQPRTAMLMRGVAVGLGVPEQLVLVESQSRNTREHPLRLRELPGVSADTRVGLVTSSWHMRRALRQFRKIFPHTIPHPTAAMTDEPWTVNDFLPSSNSLSVSTMLLDEWIGIAWYALRG